MSRPRVELRGLSKTFPGTRALIDVDLDVFSGEVHALVGGNGSGKSTLIKILCGIYSGDEGGTLRIQDHEVPVSEVSPHFARTAGIHAVHQDLGVFTDMSVAENLALGRGYETATYPRIRWAVQRRRARALLERFEIQASPNTLLRDLSQSVRTQVAIARALQDEDEESEGLLILDEPTSSLPAHEVEHLLAMLHRYASKGRSILYVSHRLQEVLTLSTRMTVLRDGRRVATLDAADTDEEMLVNMIVGRTIGQVFPEMPEVTDSETMLSVRNLSAGPLSDVDLDVARGEVVGVAGLLASGRSELLRAIFGDIGLDSGEMSLEREPFQPKRPADAIAAGIALIPEDRASDAAFQDLSVATNITAANAHEYWSWSRPWMARRKMQRDVARSMGEFLVKAASDESPLATLSGGNQQKVILARWLQQKPRLLLLDEPTQGVDVGARAEIYDLLRSAIADGASALLVASDFEELAHVSDRVVVLRDGRVAGELTPPNLSADRLMQAANRLPIGDGYAR